MAGLPALVFLVTLSAPAAAQQQAAGSSPAACVQQANQWRTRQVTEARAAQRPIDAAALLAESRRQAAECGAQFSVATTSSAQLAELAAYYNYIGAAASARAAVQRALAATDLTPRQHAEAVLLGISVAITAHEAFSGLNAEAEALAAQLDAQPDSLLDLRIRAHQMLLSRYGYEDNDQGIQAHAQALLRLGRQLGGPKGHGVLVQAFTDLARAAGDLLHPDSALLVIANAGRELGVPIDSVPELVDARDRYALVGTPAPAVSGELWLNPDAPAGQVPMADGKVRLVQFTAHWCAPCRNSYPGMLRLAKRFEGQPFEVLFITELYGNFEGKPATEGQELAADRVYYPKHQIPFRIAVNRLPRPAGGSGGSRRPLLNQQYGVSGIPQIVVVDQHGAIRQVVIGWDQGNEQRLGTFIEGLLHGPAN